MEESRLGISVEYIPAHNYMGIWEEKASNYGEFWEHHDCDTVSGYVTSMEKNAHPVVTAHTAGWKVEKEKKIYFYGTGVEDGFTGPVPEGFELRDVPESYYLVFSYPSFDYLAENIDVMEAVEKMAWNFDPRTMGYEWNENCIHTYAGIQLRNACAEIMEKQGDEEPTGQAKITPAFNLPCKYVLHTVGPIVQGQLTKEHEELLASCYRSCLELADKNGMKSIAFCCISTGVFMFPNERAARIAVQTVKEYRKEHGSGIEVISQLSE